MPAAARWPPGPVVLVAGALGLVVVTAPRLVMVDAAVPFPELQAAASRPIASSTKSVGHPVALADPLVPMASPPAARAHRIAGGARPEP